MKITDKARKLRQTIETLSGNLTDDEAVRNYELFPNWQTDMSYATDARVQYEGALYKCLQSHTSQDTWTPTDAPSLWAKVLIPDPTIIPEWVQPDSTNPYMKGDKVRHIGKIWISDIDNNVWEPGAPGTEALWSEVAE